jgi:hypothetical protein
VATVRNRDVLTYPFGQSITLVGRSRSGEDAYGNDTWTESTTTVVGVFAPGGSSELVQGQDTVISQPTVYLPAGTDVTAVDQIEVGGVRYLVDGTPNTWASPFTGWKAGVEVRLERVTG